MLVFKDDGSLLAGRVSATGFQSFRSHRLGSATMWAHPAILNDRIIVRVGRRIAAYGPAGIGPDDEGPIGRDARIADDLAQGYEFGRLEGAEVVGAEEDFAACVV